MSGMWRRWARHRRIVGLTHLTLAAVAIAVAVLTFITGHATASGFLVGLALALSVNAVIEFIRAAHYAQLAN